MNERQVQERVGRVEALLGELDSLADEGAKATAVETMQALLELYREGLSRLMERLDQLGGQSLREAVASDELVAHLLLLHDLHPVDVTTRVLRALEEVRPYLESHNGNVELVSVQDGVARVRLQGSCKGCPASAMTLKQAIEEAVLKAAPDLERIEAEGATDLVDDTERGLTAGEEPIRFTPAHPLPMYTECPSQLGQATSTRTAVAVDAGALR